MDRREIYNPHVQTETPSDEFVLRLRFPSLQEMAYSQIAIAVWYRYCSTPRQRDYEHMYRPESFNELELMNCRKLIETLMMPGFMKEILNKRLKRVCGQTIRCAYYFRYELFSSNLVEYGIRQVDWEYFVWCPDGRINYKSTAIKMLHSRKLTDVQKFAIMSHFCLENEIKIFDLNRLPMKTFIPKVKEDRDFLLFYWICYLKNELHSMASSSFSIRTSYHEYRFHSMYYLIHGGAFEYFWNRLNAEDQVTFISDKLFKYGKCHWYHSLYYKMSHDQLTNLLERQPVNVVSLFIKGWEMPEWAIMAWKRCKNRISNEQFVDLLARVLGRFYTNPTLHQEYKMSVVLEIWNTANDHQKIHAARQARLEKAAVHLILSATNSLGFDFAPDDPRLWKKLAPSTFKFLLKFLSLKSADFRKNLILEGDPSFIFNFDFHVVHEIFELCLPNFQGEVEFNHERSKHAIRPYFCKMLYTVKDYDELNRRLLRSFQNLNIPSKDILQKFIESLIVANKRESETYYPYNGNDKSDLIRLGQFVAKILHENASTVLKMKESYFSSFSSATSDPYERYGSLNELSKLIEQEFVHEHLQELKNRLAEKLQATSVEQWVCYVYEYEKFAFLFPWCYENEEEMFLQVERCIPITNIVRKVLEGIVRYNISLSDFVVSTFNNLERFLEWYFSGVAEKVISFKLSIMSDPENAKILEYMQQNKNNKWLREKFLQWNWPA
ncbi:uncharacterized protein LOC135845738 isoform X2 [Planococcus citri]|uniref:uncharacterized protein LOC135845738 isoform X2 n=1 Tax=Planococcus citri TaxID=170843 RepID=UPI0031F81785